ncbi:MAG TPA: adenosylcobinamide-phosphate synthase CbiB [Candidatus Angelobacter sp.]|nr:adenosylcobinamide-phosphate synthase CbiB [Candidatus Angelobacter sp.]
MHVISHITAWDSFISCAIALVLDFCIGDPQSFPHPVRGIGWLITKLERLLYRPRHRVLSGFILLFTAVLAVGLSVEFLLLIAAPLGHYMQVAVAAALIWSTISVRDLFDHAERVRLALKRGDIRESRSKLSAMVSRDTDNLDEAQLSRGCVESIAENLVDGVVSPLFFALLGGPVLAYVFKVVSTLDSMVGYRNEKYHEFGRASARADDVLNYIPARLMFVTLPVAALFGEGGAVKCFRAMLQDGQKNPSPNSGIPEAGFAGAMGIRLGGASSYSGSLIAKSTLNEAGRPPAFADIRRAQILLFSAAITSFCFLVLLRFKVRF